MLSTVPGWVSEYASRAFWTGWNELMIYSNHDFAKERKKRACDRYGLRLPGDDPEYSEVSREGAKLVRWVSYL